MNQTLKGYINVDSSGNLQQWDYDEWDSGNWFETDIILGRNRTFNSSISSVATIQSSIYANRAFVSLVNAVSNSLSNVSLIFTLSSTVSCESDIYARFTTWLVGVCNSKSNNLQEWSRDEWGNVIWGTATWSGILTLLTKAYAISGASNATSSFNVYLSKNKYITSEITELSSLTGDITMPKVFIGAINAILSTPYTNLSRILGLISDVNATTHITARPLSTQTTDEYRLVPLSKYIFDNAVLSLQMNSEMSNIYRWLDGLTHGTDVVYGGRYKLKFNKTLNTLDIVYNKQMFVYNGNGNREYNTTEDTVVARISSNGNVSIKGTLTQSASL